MASNESEKKSTSSLDSSFPVLLPLEKALTYSEDNFQAYTTKLLRGDIDAQVKTDIAEATGVQAGGEDARSYVTSSWVGEKGLDELILGSVKSINTDSEDPDMRDVISVVSGLPNNDAEAVPDEREEKERTTEQPFMRAVFSSGEKRKRELDDEDSPDMERKMRTDNSDIAFRSTKYAVVDLFFEVEKTISGPRLTELLNAAWASDPLTTLRIIFLTRSIYLGKGERETFYRCYGWLKQHHPSTALANLKWLNKNLIEKKVEKKHEDDKEKSDMQDEDEDIVVVDMDESKSEAGDEQVEVKNGVAHGYWKDLLNLMVMAARDKLNENQGSPQEALNEPANRKATKNIKQDVAREKRHGLEKERHENVVKHFESNAFYKAMHLTVARLFASQLSKDQELLQSKIKGSLRNLSLAAKWAPSLEKFHDKHSLIATSIAEIMYPVDQFDPSLDRETYLKHARESYRKFTLSPLRKALKVVERDITMSTFSQIDYTRVPSLAMQRYQSLFITKDEENFGAYLDKVVEGAARISGAVLNPAQLVSQVRMGFNNAKLKDPTQAAIVAAAKQRVASGQWETLVQRIRDSGTLSNTIAVADVSGSMERPYFPDNTVPIDSAIGLALVVAEVTEHPFGGAIITFHEQPSIVQVGGKDDRRTFVDKIYAVQELDWGMKTNFASVFEDLILPRALEYNVKPEDMVKRVIVFSDMHFDSAQWPYHPSERLRNNQKWKSSFERIQQKFRDAGYDMPQLVFWNLAGGRAGYPGASGDAAAPKPVDADEPGTSMVGGYSQAMLKVFLEGGSFDEVEEEEEIEKAEEIGKQGEDGAEVDMQAEGQKDKVGIPTDKTILSPADQADKKSKNSLAIVRRATGHRAYQMLTVVD